MKNGNENENSLFQESFSINNWLFSDEGSADRDPNEEQVNPPSHLQNTLKVHWLFKLNFELFEKLFQTVKNKRKT